MLTPHYNINNSFIKLSQKFAPHDRSFLFFFFHRILSGDENVIFLSYPNTSTEWLARPRPCDSAWIGDGCSVSEIKDVKYTTGARNTLVLFMVTYSTTEV